MAHYNPTEMAKEYLAKITNADKSTKVRMLKRIAEDRTEAGYRQLLAGKQDLAIKSYSYAEALGELAQQIENNSSN